MKFIKDKIPPERDITKTELYKRTLRVHDVLLQRVDEFNDQVRGVEAETIHEIGNSIGELIKMNEKMVSNYHSDTTKALKEINKLAERNMDQVKDFNKELYKRLDYHVKTKINTELETFRQEIQALLNMTTMKVDSLEKSMSRHKKENSNSIQKYQESILKKISENEKKYQKVLDLFKSISKNIK